MSSTLSAHSPKFQSKLVTLDQIRQIPEPLARGSRHKPVHHARLIDTVLAEIGKRNMTITREQYAVARNQAALFGVIDFASLKTGRGLSFGFRSSTDQLMAIRAVAGTRVFVCDNLALSGDTIAFHRKHTTGLDLSEVVGVGFDKFVEQAQVLDLQIEILELTAVSDVEAKNRIFDVFNAGVLPLHLFSDVSRFYFKPTDEQTDCQPRTLWGLHNAMTRAARDLSPVRLFRASIDLGRAFHIHTDLDDSDDDVLDGEVVSDLVAV